jgi:hypothetical protein
MAHQRTHHKDLTVDELIKTNDDKYTGFCLINGCNNKIMNNHIRPYFCSKHNRGVTLEKCIIRHGDEKGKLIWSSYCDKQAKSNTYEYKKEKYNWSKEKFDMYNKDRAVTSQNCIDRHGTKKGTIVYNNYCKKQKYVGVSLDYFKEKYGLVEGEQKYKELNKKKCRTVENYIRKYGEIEGPKKYLDFIQSRRVGFYSKNSKELFESVLRIQTYKKTYYADTEYGIYDKENKTYYKYDFTCLDTMKIIEFNGIMFHPKSKYDKSFFNPYDKSVKSEDVWIRDINKKRCAELHDFEVLYVWEDEYNNHTSEIIKKCVQFLKGI